MKYRKIQKNKMLRSTEKSSTMILWGAVMTTHHCMSVSEKSLSYRDIAYRWHAIVLLKQGCYERSRCRSKLYVPGRNCVVVPTGAKTHLFDCLRGHSDFVFRR